MVANEAKMIHSDKPNVASATCILGALFVQKGGLFVRFQYHPYHPMLGRLKKCRVNVRVIYRQKGTYNCFHFWFLKKQRATNKSLFVMHV